MCFSKKYFSKIGNVLTNSRLKIENKRFLSLIFKDSVKPFKKI